MQNSIDWAYCICYFHAYWVWGTEWLNNVAGRHLKNLAELQWDHCWLKLKPFMTLSTNFWVYEVHSNAVPIGTHQEECPALKPVWQSVISTPLQPRFFGHDYDSNCLLSAILDLRQLINEKASLFYFSDLQVVHFNDPVRASTTPCEDDDQPNKANKKIADRPLSEELKSRRFCSASLM